MSDPQSRCFELKGDDELTRALDLRWLSDDESAAVKEAWLSAWRQVPFDETFHDRCRQRLERCRPLALGPARRRRFDQTENRLVLVSDPAAPDEVFVSLSHAMPSSLWLAAPATREGLLEAVASYIDPERPLAVELERTHRMVKPLDVDRLEQIEQAVRGLELWVDDATWGSAFDDDPWRGVDGPIEMLDQARWREEAAAEDPDRFPSLGFRMLWSGSTMRVEQHPMGMWVFDLRYRPAADKRVIASLNDLLGIRLPEDVPVDLAASLLRGGVIDAHLVAELQARGEAPLDRAAVACGHAPAEIETGAILQAVVDEVGSDEQALATLANLASRYRHDALLFALWRQSEGTPLGNDLELFLSPAADLPEDPHG